MTSRVRLTDKAIQGAEAAPPGKRMFLWDAHSEGLALRITDRGHKSWIVQRRVAGKMVRVTLGDYPTISLKRAREEASPVLERMDRGVDPRPERRRPIIASASAPDSFAVLSQKWLNGPVKRDCRRKTHIERTRYLRKVFGPQWDSWRARDIAPRDIRAALEDITEAGHSVSALRARGALHAFFAWCLEREDVSVNPVTAVKKPAKETSRDRVLSDGELAEIWMACDAVGWPFGPLTRALILTGQRRGEVAGMQWEEINRESRLWILPASRVKNARPHQVPISDALLAILDGAPRGKKGETGPVFTTNFTSASSGFSRAKRRLDHQILEARRSAAEAVGGDPNDAKPLPHWSPHDIRRSCATRLAELGVRIEVIEAMLNHVSGARAGVAGVYNRASYAEERKAALSMWAEHVASITAPPPAAAPSSGNVVALRRPK